MCLPALLVIKSLCKIFNFKYNHFRLKAVDLEINRYEEDPSDLFEQVNPV